MMIVRRKIAPSRTAQPKCEPKCEPQDSNGECELQASWKDQDISNFESFEEILKSEPAWDIYQLRATALLYERVTEQLLRLENSEEYVQRLWEIEDLDDVEAGTLKKHPPPPTMRFMNSRRGNTSTTVWTDTALREQTDGDLWYHNAVGQNTIIMPHSNMSTRQRKKYWIPSLALQLTLTPDPVEDRKPVDPPPIVQLRITDCPL